MLGTAVFADGNIPASGSNAELIVGNPAEVFTLTTEPVTRSVVETYASDMSVVVQLSAMVGVSVRHPAAVQVVSSAAYPQAPTFA